MTAKTYTIDQDNVVEVFANLEEAAAADSQATFASQAELEEATKGWKTSRLVDLWNSIPGLTPVAKFTDRKTAIARIWKAVSTWEPTVPVDPKPALKPGTAAFKEEVVRKAKERKTRAATPKPATTTGITCPAGHKHDHGAPCPGDWPIERHGSVEESTSNTKADSKKAIVLDLLKQPGGATLDQLVTATGWQKHSVRGFLSGQLTKKMGLVINSTKTAAGRVYSL